MAVTPIWVCGSECGIITGATSNHYDPQVIGTGGAITSDTTFFRPGGLRSLKVAATGAITNMQSPIAAGTTVAMARVYFYFATLPGADCSIVAFTTASGSTGTASFIRYTTATTNLVAILTPSGVASTGSAAIVAGKWYRLDIKYNVSATTYTMDWQLDGVGQGQASLTAQTIGTAGKLKMGVLSAVTATVYFDDMVAATALAADAYIGEGRVVGYVPVSSGTHVETAGDLQDDASANVAVNETTSWAKVDEVPMTSNTDFIKQVVLRSTSYVEYLFATGGENVPPRAVEHVTLFHNTTTGTNTQKAQLYDGTTAADSYALVSAGSVAGTLASRRKCYTQTPSATAWTPANFNSLRGRWGFAGDVTGPPAMDAMMLEAEFPPRVPYSTPYPQLLPQ